MIFYSERPRNPVNKTVGIASVEKQQSVVKKGNQWFETCSPQYLLLIVLLVASLFVSSTTLVLFFTRIQPLYVNKTYAPIVKGHIITFQNHLKENVPNTIEHHLEKHLNLTSSTNLTILTRQEWLAEPPKEVTPLSLPVPYVIIMHTATTNCSVRPSCVFSVHAIQSFHIENRKWSDIAYNFLIGGDGIAYEGRGWERQGAHTYGYNSKSIGIALIGNFNRNMPTKKQILAAKELIQLGVKEGYISPNYKLYGARQLQATESPGLMLYEDLKKWPHWTKHERNVFN